MLALVFSLLPVSSRADSAYPILFIHGLVSDDRTWQKTAEALKGRLGYHNAFTETTIHACLNFDGNSAVNNLEIVETVGVGSGEPEVLVPPANPYGADIWINYPPTVQGGRSFYRINFDVSPGGVTRQNLGLSNQEAILKQGKVVGRVIDRILGETLGDKVILVAHSMGGLAARAYLQWGRSGEDSVGAFWLDGRHRVAKLLTIGTPHLGANLAASVLSEVTAVDQKSAAARDLAYSFSENGPPDEVVDGPGLLIYGGDESSVPGTGTFYSADVNCDGQGTVGIRGLNVNGNTSDNPTQPLPRDVEYFWLVGTDGWVGGDGSDCMVRADRQSINGLGDSLEVLAKHSAKCPGACVEFDAMDAIVEGLDEGDRTETAYLLRQQPIGYLSGHLSCQYGDAVVCRDEDYFRLEVEEPQVIEVTLNASAPVLTSVEQLELLDGSSQLIALDTAPPFRLTHVFSSGDLGAKYVRVVGTADPSDLDEPCGSATVLLSSPYQLSARIGSTGVQVTAVPSTVGVGLLSDVSATVLMPSGQSVGAGVAVAFSSTGGALSGCSGTISHCVSLTDQDGVASVWLSSAGAGSIVVAAQPETGGVGQVAVTFGTGTTSVSATPNPVSVNSASSLVATIRDVSGNPVGAGLSATFSTSFPGGFSGTGCTISPCSSTTNASGQALINFTPWAAGAANITVAAPGVSAAVLALESVRPSSAIDVQLSVGYRGGDASSTQYEVEARVFDAGGQPIIGDRVDFTSSRGSLSSSWGSTSSSGIAQTILTVATSGETTVTGSARGVQAATTFSAQVGGSGASAMSPVKTFNLGSPVYGVAYSPDCSTLVAASEGGLIRAWNTSDWSLKWPQTARSSGVGQVSISPNGQKVLVAQSDGTDIYDVSNGNFNCTAPAASGDESINAVFTSDSTFVRTGDGSSTIPASMYRHSSLCQATGSPAYTPPNEDDFQPHAHLDYSNGKQWVAVVSHDAQLYVNNASTLSLVRTEAMSSGSSRGHDVDFSSDGSKLLALGYNVIKLFNTTNWTFSSFSAPSLGTSGYFGAKLIDSDTKFAVGGTNKLEVIGIAGGATLRTADIGGEGLEIDWCQGRAELAVGTSSGNIEIYRPLAPPDAEGPTISVTTPPNGFATNAASIAILGRVTDQTGVTSFKVNQVEVALDQAGYFSHAVALSPGANLVEFSALDPIGNTSSASRNVTRLVDSIPPAISDCQAIPATGVAGTFFNVQCSIMDGDTGVASASATIRNGATVVVDSKALVHYSGSTWGGSFDSSAWAVGGYYVDVSATDSSLQTNVGLLSGATSLAVLLPPPTLTLISPSTGFSLGGASVTLSGSNFRTGAAVTFGGIPAPVTGLSASTLTVSSPAHEPGSVAVVVTNADGQSVGKSPGFAYVAPIAPTASTAAVSSITLTSAQLNATVNPNGTLTDVSFDWGPTTSYGSVAAYGSAGAGSSPVQTPRSIAGLACSTEYHYRVRASNAGGSAAGSDMVFSTTVCPPPGVETLEATDVSSWGATLNASVNPNGAATTASFDFGPTAVYGATFSAGGAGAGATPVTLANPVVGLMCATEYHYRARAANAGGSTNGGDQSFSTEPCPPPSASTQAASGVGSHSATLNGLVNPNGVLTTVEFDYGTTTSYNSTASYGSAGAGNIAIATPRSVSGLNCATPYHFRVRSTSSGGTAFGDDLTFTTGSCGEVPEVFTDGFESGDFTSWTLVVDG